MSGIFGILNNLGTTVDPDRLLKMSDALVRRGPHGSRLWLQGGTGLGHRMLRTTPEAKEENLPYHDPLTGLTITSDARLDNRDELISSLGRDAFKMDVIPDSQILLHSYLKWKTECVHRLIGDYSFAIWDCDSRVLFCARDHLGVKPFNYYYQGEYFLFCSDAFVLAKHSGISVSINEGRIADHLTPHLEGLDTTSTFYTSIYRLPPAHFLELKNGKLAITRYWDPQPSTCVSYKSDAECREALTEILIRSVAARTRGINNPAVLLSGGVDSAAVLGVAQHIRKNRTHSKVHGFSGISEAGASCKESKMINLLAQRGGYEAHCYTPKHMVEKSDSIFKLLLHIGEPFDFCMILILFLYQQAAEKGNRVVLDGVDGDMVASLSSDYPSKLFRLGRVSAAVRETICQSRGEYRGFASWYKLLGRYVFSACTPQILKNWSWQLNLSSSAQKVMASSQINPEFSKRAKLEKRLIQFERETRKTGLSFPVENYLQNVQHPFLTVGLERYDRIASLCSVEPRHPLLSKHVVDFYSGLPWDQFVREGWSKYLLRRVAEQYSPPEVCWRLGKEHLGGLFTTILLHGNRPRFGKIFCEEQDALSKFFKKTFVQSLLISYNNSRKCAPSTIHSDVAGLAIWLKNNFNIDYYGKERR